MNRSTLGKTLALIVLVITMLSFAVAAAAGASSISLNPTVSAPTFGSTVSFTVTTASDSPFVSVTCLQGKTFVYQQTHPYFGDFYSQFKNFLLVHDSTYDVYTWNGGGASCTAQLWVVSNGRVKNLANTSFNVLSSP